jgi:hypothetical protein
MTGIVVASLRAGAAVENPPVRHDRDLLTPRLVLIQLGNLFSSQLHIERLW